MDNLAFIRGRLEKDALRFLARGENSHAAALQLGCDESRAAALCLAAGVNFLAELASRLPPGIRIRCQRLETMATKCHIIAVDHTAPLPLRKMAVCRFREVNTERGELLARYAEY